MEGMEEITTRGWGGGAELRKVLKTELRLWNVENSIRRRMQGVHFHDLGARINGCGRFHEVLDVVIVPKLLSGIRTHAF